MPLLPRKSALAITAVTDIALNLHSRPLTGKALAEHCQLPSRHLEPILQALVRAGILRGIGGQHGGYMLGREQRRITARDILHAIGVADDETLGPALAQVEDVFSDALSHISVEDLTRNVKHNKSGFDDHLAGMRRNRSDLLEQIRLTVETIKRSQNLLKQVDEQLAKSPLKP
jgi:DNA-binding IscR family transcriptional regulator